MSRYDVRPQLPALFTKFVRQMQGLDTRALRRLYTSASSASCEKAKYIIYAPVYVYDNTFIVEVST